MFGKNPYEEEVKRVGQEVQQEDLESQGFQIVTSDKYKFSHSLNAREINSNLL